MKINTSKFAKNVTWVFAGNAFHAVFQFLINVVAARAFSENEYGMINYSISLIALFSAVCTLGFGGVISKKFAENEENGGIYLLTAFLSRILVSLPFVAVSMLIGYGRFKSDPDFFGILLCQALSLIFSAGDIFVYWYRYKYEASKVAIIRFLSFAIMAAFRLYAIIVFKSTVLYVLFTVMETAILSLCLIYIYVKTKQSKLKFRISAMREMLAVSYPFIFSAILSTIYGQTDKLMLESMVSTEAVAYYSVSLTLASAISILPTALIEGFRPEIFVQRQSSEKNYRKRLSQLYGIVFWVCILYCAFITLFARQIITILYGIKYTPAVESLSLIVWYTAFSYFGAINNIYMIAEGKTKWVQIITLIGAVLNVILNALLIPLIGISGAALASLITQVFTNFVLLVIFRPLRKAFFIALQGIGLTPWGNH